MALPFHIVEAPDGAAPRNSDRFVLGPILGTANASGAAGATVSTAVNLPAGALPVDVSGNALYAVYVSPNQKCFWWVDTKTHASFVVHMAPDTGADSIASGKFDLLIVA